MTNGNGNDFGSGDKYNEVEFKAEHPKTPTMNINYKIRFEHNSNHELTKGKLSIKRKWGNEPKFVEFTSNMVLNKIDGSILLRLVLPDATRWKIEGAVTASNVLGELRHGFNAKLIRNNKIHRSLVITVYPVIHAIQLETVKFDTRDQNLGKTFKMFAGFIDEDADKFAIRMIHKNQASTVNHFVDHSVASLVNVFEFVARYHKSRSRFNIPSGYVISSFPGLLESEHLCFILNIFKIQPAIENNVIKIQLISFLFSFL